MDSQQIKFKQQQQQRQKSALNLAKLWLSQSHFDQKRWGYELLYSQLEQPPELQLNSGKVIWMILTTNHQRSGKYLMLNFEYREYEALLWGLGRVLRELGFKK